jgi:hypothetical protein
VSHGGVEWKEDMKMVFSCFSRGMLFDVWSFLNDIKMLLFATWIHYIGLNKCSKPSKHMEGRCGAATGTSMTALVHATYVLIYGFKTIH